MKATSRDVRSRTRFERALGHARAGRHASSRAEVKAALNASGEDPAARMVAAGLLFVSRDHQAALDQLSLAAAAPGFARAVVEDVFRFAGALGWDQEVRQTLERAMALEPNETRWPVLAMRLYTRADAPGRALAMARRALSLNPGSPRLELEVAHLAIACEAFDDAASTARALFTRGSEDPRIADAASDVLAEAGDFSRAEAHWRASGHARAIDLAELALARGHVAEARARVVDAPVAGRERVLGAAALLDGEPEAAIAHLERALEHDPENYLNATWRAEAALRVGDLRTAHDRLDRATMRAPAFFFAARLLRYLTAEQERGEDDEPVGAHRLEEFRGPLLEIVPEARAALDGGDALGIRRAVELALVRMRGNRSVRATFVDESGALRLVQDRTGVRYASRRALQWIRTLPPRVTLEALDDVVARYPGASLPVCHRGELQLWLGDLAAAERDLWRSIELHRWTRWAYIGLAGVELSRGRPRNALMTSEHGVAVMGGTTGPAVFVYRGEAQLRLGALDEARADLEKAVALTPTRVGAWVGLALTYDRLGELERFEAAWARLVRTAPGLLSTAGASLGVEVFIDPGQAVPIEARRTVLEACLVCLRGNRSTSCATYFDPEGRLRFVQPFSSDEVAVHGRDQGVLDHVERRLRGGVETG